MILFVNIDRFVHENVSLEILMEQSKECIQKLCVN